MLRRSQKWWTLAAVIGLAWWLFGNLYEAVVFSPNWVTDQPAQQERLHGFFQHTSPTWYFVPVTQLAVVLLWALTALNQNPDAARHYRRASVVSLVLMALNAFIVSTVISKLFGDDFRTHGAGLAEIAREWNILNGVRMALTALTIGYAFAAFRKLDQLG